MAFTSMTTRIGILLSTNIIKVWMKISFYSVNNPIMIYVEWARMLSDCMCCLYLLINTILMGNIFYLNILFYTNFNLDLLVYCIEHKFHCLIEKSIIYQIQWWSNEMVVKYFWHNGFYCDFMHAIVE